MRKKATKIPFFTNYNPRRIILLEASTGGTETIKKILTTLPNPITPVFSLTFDKRMNDLYPFEVKEATNNERLKQNTVLISPGNYHLHLKQKDGSYYVRLDKSIPI